MLSATTLAFAASIGLLASAQVYPDSTQDGPVIADTVNYGPAIELVHLYYDEFPTGIAVSKTGRKFSNYPGGLDANDTNNGVNKKYTIAELFANNTERPYPSAEINNPPGGAINYTTSPPSGANYPNYLIGSQSVIVDALDRVWILDTGRVLTPNGTLVPATYGGPKLVGVDLATNKVFQTILFPQTVAYPDSYLNDVRIDTRANLSGSTGKGVAYITDSSLEGRNGIVIVDLGSGKSWRHLDGNAAVHAATQPVFTIWGVPIYTQSATTGYIGYVGFGADGIALSASGNDLYFKTVANRYLYSVPTALLRSTSPTSDVLAQAAIVSHGETGISDGMETDSNGLIYHGNMEAHTLGVFNPANGTDGLLVRDPRLNWLDTLSVGADGYIYFTNNQLVFGPAQYPGTDRRQRPFSLWRTKLPGNGTKGSF